MKFSSSLLRGLALLLMGLLLNGCLPSAPSQLEEEKEPHFLAGKSRVSALDYNGAVESFAKALEVNPRSASAHFELACLFDQKESDPAAAIYHYEHYLRLRPKAENREIVKQHIMACKQELAKTVSLGPISEKVQRELEQALEEKKRLTDENKSLREELDKWRAYGAYLQTNQARAAAPVARPESAPPPPVPYGIKTNNFSAPNSGGTSTTSSTGGRSHTVKTGETLAKIARQYGISTDKLLNANPSLNPRRMKVGQVLNIPGA